MLVVQLYLDLLAGGVWGPDDEWIDDFAQVLAVAVMPPTKTDDMPERGQPYVGALVAVGLALMSENATLHGGREQDLVFQRAWDAVGTWAAQAEPDLIDHYLYQPAQTYSRVADRQDVDAVVELASAAINDPTCATPSSSGGRRCRSRLRRRPLGQRLRLGEATWLCRPSRYSHRPAH